MDSGASDEEVEEQFTMQLEQLIKQCEDELGLIPKMAEWKPWEVPPGHKVIQLFPCQAVLSCPSSFHLALSRHAGISPCEIALGDST